MACEGTQPDETARQSGVLRYYKPHQAHTAQHMIQKRLRSQKWRPTQRVRNSVTNSRADCALTQQMIGCIKAISPCVKTASAKLFLDLHTVLAPSGEERTLNAAAQVERAGRCCSRFYCRTHAWCGRAAVSVLVSSASGLCVSGCIRAPRYFNLRMVPISNMVSAP